MQRLPAEIRDMTPRDTEVLVAAWNEAHGDGAVKVMSSDRFHELKAMYPDE